MKLFTFLSLIELLKRPSLIILEDRTAGKLLPRHILFFFLLLIKAEPENLRIQLHLLFFIDCLRYYFDNLILNYQIYKPIRMFH